MTRMGTAKQGALKCCALKGGLYKGGSVSGCTATKMEERGEVKEGAGCGPLPQLLYLLAGGRWE